MSKRLAPNVLFALLRPPRWYCDAVGIFTREKYTRLGTVQREQTRTAAEDPLALPCGNGLKEKGNLKTVFLGFFPTEVSLLPTAFSSVVAGRKTTMRDVLIHSRAWEAMHTVLVPQMKHMFLIT